MSALPKEKTGLAKLFFEHATPEHSEREDVLTACRSETVQAPVWEFT